MPDELPDRITLVAREIRNDIGKLDERLTSDLRELGNKVDGYVVTLGNEQGSRDTATKILLALGGTVAIAVIGFGVYAIRQNNAIERQLGANVESIASLKEGLDSASVTVQSTRETLISLGNKIDQGEKLAARLPDEIKGIATTLDSQADEVRKLEESVAMLQRDIGTIKTAVKSIDSLTESTKQLEKGTAETEKALEQLQSGVRALADQPAQPGQSNDVVIRFSVGEDSRIEAAEPGKQETVAAYLFEVPITAASAISREDVRDITVTLDPLAVNDGEPLPSANCSALVPRENILRITVRVPTKSASAITQIFAAKRRISGQAVLRLVTPIIEQP